jgi:hypothetical protein
MTPTDAIVNPSTSNHDQLAQPPVPQTRAAILETDRPYDAETLRRAMLRLADSGWNTIILPGFYNGLPVFPSPVWAEYGLPRRSPAFRKWDPFAVASELAYQRGLDLFISVTPYLIDSGETWRRPPVLRRFPAWQAMQHPKRSHRPCSNGNTPRYYCPANPDLKRFLGDALFVLLEAYPFAGLLLDLRHYPFYTPWTGDNRLHYCYCKSCRAMTLRDLGFDPAEIDFDTELQMVERWKDWQSLQMEKALSYIRVRALKARSTMRILGLLTSDAATNDKEHRQLSLWKPWVEQSLVEELVLEGYSTDSDTMKAQVEGDLGALPQTSLLMPMLSGDSPEPDAFLNAIRQLPIPGFTTRFTDWTDENFDPGRRLKISEPAVPIESDPILGISRLCERMSHAVKHQEEFTEFLGDLVHILMRTDVPLTVDRTLMVAKNIQGLQEKVSSRELNMGRNHDRVCLDLDLAYRLAYLAAGDLRH